MSSLNLFAYYTQTGKRVVKFAYYFQITTILYWCAKFRHGITKNKLIYTQILSGLNPNNVLVSCVTKKFLLLSLLKPKFYKCVIRSAKPGTTMFSEWIKTGHRDISLIIRSKDADICQGLNVNGRCKYVYNFIFTAVTE